MQFRSLLYAPIYDTFAVAAQISLSDGSFYTGLRAIDMTVGQGLQMAGSELETVRPTALMIRGELDDAALDYRQLDNGILTINGVNWNIDGVRPMPSPNGESDGELMLILEMIS